jgi:hypothetical protein
VSALALGHQTVLLRPRLLLAAWLLHAIFAMLAAGPAVSVFTNSLEHRPAFSDEVRHDFSLDLLVDWRAAYGDPLLPLFKAALVLAAIYGVAKLLLDAVIFPAYLDPFDDLRRSRPGHVVRGILGASLMGAGLSLGALAVLAPIASQWKPAGIAIALALAFLRVLTSLWKCAGATDGSFSDAFRVIRDRPGATLWLTLVTLAGGASFVAASAAAAWYSLESPYFYIFLAQQAVILLGVWLRLWLNASTIVLWRAVVMQPSCE